MSESKHKPRKSPPTTSEDLAFRARRERGRSRWFVASLVLHVAAIVALLYMTPVREMVREAVQRSRPTRSMSSRGLQELAEAIEYRSADQIADNARQLERSFERIEDIRDNISERFRRFERRQRAEAPQDAMREMEKALDYMDQAAQSIEEGRSIETTDRLQAVAENAQQRAAEKLAMTGFDVSEALSAQKAAAEAHQQAKGAHDRRRDVEPDLAASEQQLEEVRQQKQQREEQLQQAREDQQPQEKIEQAEQQLEQGRREVEEATEELEAQRAVAEELRRDALDAQQKAVEAQQKARRALESSIERHSRQADAQAVTGTFEPLEITEPGSVEDVKDSVPELYDTSRAFEDRIAESFKEIRAMDLAMVRDVPLDEARDDIDVIRPVRPELNRELLEGDVRSDERFDAHQQEVKKALRETSSMVNLAQRMLAMSSQSVEKMKFGTDVSLDEMEEEGPSEEDLQLVIRDLASEDMSGRFSDMAGMMAAMEQAESGEEGEEEGEQVAAAAPPVDYEDLTQDEAGDEGEAPRFSQEGLSEGNLPQLTPDVPALGTRKITADGIPTRWVYIDSWYTIGPFPNPDRVNIDREFPPDSLVDLDATYIGKGGRTIRWKFVQSTNPQVIPADPDQYGIWYAYTEIYSDRPRDVLVALGSDDRGTLKVNGVPVWLSSKRLKGWDIDEVWRRIHLKEGINRILYRVENGWLHVGFSLVLRLEE
ncbi:MAG: hypothetical protein R6X33_04865 [Candidatus Brocadiia bacterium]